jgi:hypothetical protein
MASDSPCSTCAFRPGADANREVDNRLRGQIAALSGNPFYCHHGLDWKAGNRAIGDALAVDKNQAALLNAGIPKAALIRATLPLLEGHSVTVCEGWKAEIRRLKSRGLFNDPETNQLRRQVGAIAFAELDGFLREGIDAGEKAKHRANLKECLSVLRADVEELPKIND